MRMKDEHISKGATYVDVRDVYKVIDERLKFVASNSTNPVVIRMTGLLYEELVYEISTRVCHFLPCEVG